MKFLIVFALGFATVTAIDLYFRSIEVPMLKNEGRITNGINADPGQFYYQVGLSLRKGMQALWCSGSLIGQNWILSAGHCTYTVSMIRVFLGATQRLAAEKVYNVSESDIFTHPNFNPFNFKNDISLIRIPTTAQSRRIGIIKTFTNGDEYVGDSVVVAGWGHISDNTKELSNHLQYCILKVSPGSACLEVFHSQFSDGTNICVSTPNHVSTCLGDSGGPLVLADQILQIGLLSYISKFGCGKGFPVVFTRVNSYYFWIRSLSGIA